MQFRSHYVSPLSFNMLLAFGLAAWSPSPGVHLQAAEEAAAKADDDRFKAPEGDAKTLEAFIKKLVDTSPEGTTDEEQMAFSVKLLNALVQAADKLLAAKPSDEQATEAYNYKLQALRALSSMNQKDAHEQLEKTMTAARADKRESIAGLGWQAYIMDRTSQWSDVDAAAKKTFHDDIISQIKADGPKPMDASIVQVAAMRLDGEDDSFLAKLLEDAIALFAKSDDKTLVGALEEANFEGMLRRLQLPGHEMEIKGELLGGGEVDWKSYRGKVVLVDFWATWCGPCRAEVPNVLEMYQAYHDKGFEVLGISLDKTPEDAQKYVKEMKLPWDSLFPKDEEKRYWSHPLVRYYGIGGIPTAILVGKDGKVVSMNARDKDLRDELAKLLGEPAKKIEDAASAKAETPAKAG